MQENLNITRINIQKHDQRWIIMCGRFLLFTSEEYIEIRAILEEIERNHNEELINMKTGEIAPTNYAPIITSSEENKREARLFKWGFPNFKQTSGVIINARSETIEEKPTFKKALYTKRCIIPACAFYEWKGSDKKKDKFIIKPYGYKFFYMAGIYNTYKDKNGDDYNAFAIITTAANKEMSTIHDRMPILLTSKDDCNGWLNPNMNNLPEIKAYLKPYENKLLIDNTSAQLQFDF